MSPRKIELTAWQKRILELQHLWPLTKKTETAKKGAGKSLEDAAKAYEDAKKRAELAGLPTQ